MGELTDGLLSLASMSRAQLRIDRVDLAVLARAALASCSERCPERSVEIAVAAELPAMGDPRLLAQVIGNLVGNAWKFTSHRSQAVIEVCGTPDANGQWVYFVRDNGAGFIWPMPPGCSRHSSACIRPPNSRGPGIGLAIVHRIVTRHGGRIWAEGTPGQGANFNFTLGARGA